MGTRENKTAGAAQNNSRIMRCALFISLIAAARAFAPPSILRATVVVKNEADSASADPESHRRIYTRARMNQCRHAPLPIRGRRVPNTSLGAPIVCKTTPVCDVPAESRSPGNTPASARARTAVNPSTRRPSPATADPHRTQQQLNAQAASDTTTAIP